MKAYKFKSNEDKAIFHAFLMHNVIGVEVDMFEFNKCIGVRITLNNDIHLLKCEESFAKLELIKDITSFIISCN